MTTRNIEMQGVKHHNLKIKKKHDRRRGSHRIYFKKKTIPSDRKKTSELWLH